MRWLAGVPILLIAIELFFLLRAAEFNFRKIMFSFPPDTFEDMAVQLDNLRIPNEFALVSYERSGMRNRFAAAPSPHMVRVYSADWDGGRVCERLRRLLPKEVVSIPNGGADCRWEFSVPSGWSSRPLNVWQYPVRLQVSSPERRTQKFSSPDCARYRKEREQLEMGLFGRIAECYASDDRALVVLGIDGKTGW